MFKATLSTTYINRVLSSSSINLTSQAIYGLRLFVFRCKYETKLGAADAVAPRSWQVGSWDVGAGFVLEEVSVSANFR